MTDDSRWFSLNPADADTGRGDLSSSAYLEEGGRVESGNEYQDVDGTE